MSRLGTLALVAVLAYGLANPTSADAQVIRANYGYGYYNPGYNFYQPPVVQTGFYNNYQIVGPTQYPNVPDWYYNNLPYAPPRYFVNQSFGYSNYYAPGYYGYYPGNFGYGYNRFYYRR
jgi:hypothetical protein